MYFVLTLYTQHQIAFNYTTYDVRRARDIVNPATPRCNIMLLDSMGASGSPSKGRFLYARVLGAYHANVIYTGPGMADYKARRLEFLWVRWYRVDSLDDDFLAKSLLPELSFHPIHSPLAFGFIDPSDVLRTCHILPRFAKLKRHEHAGGKGFSRCAKDQDDYRSYYIGW